MRLSELTNRRFIVLYFRDAFLGQLSRHLPLVAVLLFLAAVSFLDLGSAYGMPLLFWHEIPWKAFLAGCAVALLIAKVLFTAFLLDTNRRADDPRRWLDGLQAPTADDDLWQAGCYMVGGAICLLIVVVVGVAVWGIGRAIIARQDGSNSPANQSLQVPWFSYVSFGVGLLAGLLIAYALWRMARIVLQGRREDDLSPMLEKVLFLKRGMSPTQQRLHVLAAAFAGFLAVIFVINSIILPDWLGTPATGLCTLLGLMVAAYGYTAYRVANPSLLLAAIIGLLILGGIPQYKNQLRALKGDYDNARLARLADYGKSKNVWGLYGTDEPHWATEGKPRPLVIICVSGGGIRAAVWAAAVMRQLETAEVDFPYHVRIITGASGGMVGMAYYTATLNDPRAHATTSRYHAVGDSDDRVIDRLALDSLSRTTKQMIYRDVPRLLLPLPGVSDRGQAMEDQWRTYWGERGWTTFGQLRAGEADGWRPSLIFSPMLIEDGRRLFISNLDLSFMMQNYGPRLNNPNKAFYSQAGFEFSRLFPEEIGNFPLVTAARLNASFPYVSPTAELPTVPRRRVADAGYYDNYGVSVAGAWLTEYLTRPRKLKWLGKQVSGVLLVQIRDGPSDLDQPADAIGPSPGSPAGRGFEWLTSPIAGLLSARDSVSRLRNDSQLNRLGQMFKAAGFAKGYFTTATFSFNGGASLSWYLTRKEKQNLLDTARALQYSDQMQTLKVWWSDVAEHPSATTEPSP